MMSTDWEVLTLIKDISDALQIHAVFIEQLQSRECWAAESYQSQIQMKPWTSYLFCEKSL